LQLIEDGKIILYRIPFEYRDRRLRPYDVNTGKDDTIFGTLKYVGRNVHDFHIPNDPSMGYWKNFCLEDFARYWDLKNIIEAKYVYFKQIDFANMDIENRDVFPIKSSIKDAIIENGKEKNLKLDRNYKGLSLSFTSAAAFFSYLLYLSF
jgi:hypothetical protein